MAEHETRGISPSYTAICSGVAGDPDVLARLDTLPTPKRQPNLLLGVVRFLGGPVSSWPVFRDFILDRWDDVAAQLLVRRTQTNEPNRCTTLLSALAALPQPLALLEVGASMGLCLFPDRYAYRYRRGDSVVEVGAGEVRFACDVTGPAPLPARLPEVVWRAGLDLYPLDVMDDEDVRWLESLIWPEQVHRFAGLAAAVRIARAEPPRIVRGDLRTDLPALAAEAPAGATLVLFHSAVLAYLPRADRETFAATVRELAGRQPLCWLSNEAPGVVPGPAIDTGGRSRFVLARDCVPLALTGPHGQSLDWLG